MENIGRHQRVCDLELISESPDQESCENGRFDLLRQGEDPRDAPLTEIAGRCGKLSYMELTPQYSQHYYDGKKRRGVSNKGGRFTHARDNDASQRWPSDLCQTSKCGVERRALAQLVGADQVQHEHRPRGNVDCYGAPDCK